MNVVYNIVCDDCNEVYIGETARNTYNRGKEHLKDLEKKSDKSVLWRHAKEKHQSNIPIYKCNVIKSFHSDALLRQISEAVLINKEDAIINNKSEWNFLNIPRAKIDHGR